MIIILSNENYLTVKKKKWQYQNLTSLKEKSIRFNSSDDIKFPILFSLVKSESHDQNTSTCIFISDSWPQMHKFEYLPY